MLWVLGAWENTLHGGYLSLLAGHGKLVIGTAMNLSPCFGEKLHAVESSCNDYHRLSHRARPSQVQGKSRAGGGEAPKQYEDAPPKA